MKRRTAFSLAVLLSVPAWSEAPAPPVPPAPEPAFKQPFPNSTGAKLLPFCEQTDVVVSQLRCNYYVQGVADLATIPLQGKPLACIPQGQNQTQLMQVAVDFLKLAPPEDLANQSAASLILAAFNAAFPCPVEKTPPPPPVPTLSKEQAEALMKMIEAQQKKGADAPKKEADAPKEQAAPQSSAPQGK